MKFNLYFSNRKAELVLFGYKKVTAGTFHIVTEVLFNNTYQSIWNLNKESKRAHCPGFAHDSFYEKGNDVKPGELFRWRNRKHLKLHDEEIRELLRTRFQFGLQTKDCWFVPNGMVDASEAPDGGLFCTPDTDNKVMNWRLVDNKPFYD